MSVPDKFTAKFANEPDLLSLNTGCGGHYNEDLTFLRSDNCGAAGNMNSKNLTQLAPHFIVMQLQFCSPSGSLYRLTASPERTHNYIGQRERHLYLLKPVPGSAPVDTALTVLVLVVYKMKCEERERGCY